MFNNNNNNNNNNNFIELLVKLKTICIIHENTKKTNKNSNQ